MADVGDYCCSIDRYLHELLDDTSEQRRRAEAAGGEYQAPQLSFVVHIGEAEKQSEGGASFIAYTVSFGEYEVKRRYSEFESLRSCLGRLYPTFIVPPIPEKHSLTQYAVLQKRAKEDQYIIERRKRMLERFLNHLVEHPILSSEHILHRFLESGVSWTEVLHSPVITGLPRSPLHSSPSRAPGSSVADGMSQPPPKIAATNALAGDVPVPSALAPIRNIEPRWMDCELFTNKYANQFSGVIEKSERRIYRRLGELASDYAELGATLNGFSLLDHPERLAAAIESAGQAVDSSYIEVGQLLTQMEAEVSEPIHEYSQYAAIIKQVLRFRLLKNLQLEGVEDALVRQRDKLERLLQADDEAKRLAQALDPGSPATAAARTAAAAAAAQAPGQQQHGATDDADAEDTQHGFSTPQRANTDASSVQGAAAGRPRGPSVSSALSATHHGDFTPTLGARRAGDGASVSGSPAAQPASLGRMRSRAGTAASGASAGAARRGSIGWPAEADGEAEAGVSDDPLAQFQQEESQLWGGGAGSTLPRLGARARSAQKQHQQQQQQQANGRRTSQTSEDLGILGHVPASMVQSEYVGSSGLARQDAKMAASTPDLWDATDDDLSVDGLHPGGNDRQRARQAGPAAAPPPPLGVRLLRSPRALGDGIMNRLTYALNGMMDVDPEQMRHNQIGRASDRISVLEEQLEMLSNDMALINTSTQDNLDRFQKQKVREVKGVLVAMARMHLEWAEKNLEIWTEAKQAVDEVDA
ncbi:Sorting nexin, cytoplasm-to-vacuole targeting pathway/endosomal sorting [Coemansia javaensis]|uniref:Sorting nexin, cytoplasm-to-vacuole targeting pathway/endosomal sorting n=1 Tax=Coemansia javaensis TaxID=2761396 RepID=A0A9W8LE34_9FUNG|nr:Sorting nexin, cytoplasm-to-vacuole targeting pathway/endosomal sorting [Coemansia javaensis]